MKTTAHVYRPSRLPQSLLIFLATACIASANTPTAPEALKDESKTHTLYMGADLKIAHGQELYRVRNVAGDAFTILVEGKEVRVPIKGNVRLEIESSLKLTENSAEIGKLKNERAYTPDNNPRKKWMESIAVSPGDSTDRQIGDTVGATPVTLVGPNGSKYENPAYAKARSDNMASDARSHSDLNSPAYYVGKMQEEEALQQFDAVDVTFDVSTGKSLRSPYVVFIAQYHPKGKPKTVHNWIYAQALKPVANEPTHVHILQGGFPLGFELAKFSVHLYDNGVEVATNVADNRVVLTREEAHLYIVSDYIGRHKGASLPATPAMAKIPADWEAHIGAGKTYFVKVDKTGHPLGVYEDNACSNKLDDAYVDSVVMAARFLPALAGGKPTDGVAKLMLADLPKYAAR